MSYLFLSILNLFDTTDFSSPWPSFSLSGNRSTEKVPRPIYRYFVYLLGTHNGFVRRETEKYAATLNQVQQVFDEKQLRI